MTALISSQAGQITRRGIFIGAAASLLCAPAIVRATSLMPVRRLRVRIAPQYAGFCERLMYQSLDSNLRADKMSTVLNGKIIPEDNARRMVAYARVQGWLRPMDCAGTRFMHSLTDLNFHSDDQSSRYSDKPLPVDWKVYDVLVYDSALNPDKMHGDLAHAAARQRFRSDGKRRPMAHDARSRTSRRVRDAVRPDGTCRSENGDRRGAAHPFAASESRCQRTERLSGDGAK
jgi:hypothetical protein